ncbi:MAG: RAMP superfamily CRISPR-associated protein [Nocardioides sp.]
MRTMTWDGTLTAISSIAHGGETRGTITLLRRELVATPAGDLVHIPIVSGNTLRGRLRRLGEELLRDAVGYEGLLHPAAAHALRGGGSLAKTGHEPLSGSRLQQLRELVPQIGVFGAAGGGTIINGALDVGKVVPHLSETAHITGAGTTRSAFSATQLEGYTRQDDEDSHDFVGVIAGTDQSAALAFDETGRPEPVLRGNNQMLFHVETFPAGTVFSTWMRLRRPSPLEASFFLEVLDTFRGDGRLGGRIGIGHGQVRVDLVDQDERDEELPDWRAAVDQNRDEILVALQGLA